jgi:lipoprotein-anchoring transpeptidase ErfK/SrfK
MIFKFKRYAPTIVFAIVGSFLFAACEPGTAPTSNANTGNIATTNQTVATTPAPAASPKVEDRRAEANLPVTLPVLDAMFADESFAAELKSKLSLTDEQIERLRTTSREAVGNLNESENDDNAGSTTEATRRAQEQIRSIIGEEKAVQLASFVRERWQPSDSNNATAGNNGEQKPNGVPSDTRIVVNAPAYRMDFFKDGQLVRSYKIGIGYPEFPLPTGMRRADTIIYNPTWTPPDEPWVKGKVQPGKKVEAGDKLNPLGPIKIPIGSPSLIHGGKNPARLGTFASHGCVGLTDAQVQQVALDLAQLTGTGLTAEDAANYGKNKTETKNVKLAQAIPVELRYETIVVEDGKLRIFRDVYERGTNTEENLRAVLQANGVAYDSLSEPERQKISEALKQMARDPAGNPVEVAQGNVNNNSNKNVKETKTIKGAKEATIEIAALKGKGYPAAIDLNTGGKSAKPLGSKTGQTANSNSAAQGKRF